LPDSLRALAAFRFGEKSFAKKAWADAYKGFSLAGSLRLSDRVFRVSYWIGESAVRAGDTSAAVTSLRAFLAGQHLDPLWEAMARYRLAVCLEASGKVEEAIAEYRRVVEIGEASAGLHRDAALRLESLGSGPSSDGKLESLPRPSGRR